MLAWLVFAGTSAWFRSLSCVSFKLSGWMVNSSLCVAPPYARCTRRFGSIKRGGGLPALPFVAFTLLRQKNDAEVVDLALVTDNGRSSSTGARTLLIPDPRACAKGESAASLRVNQAHSDTWMIEDAATVLWHAAGFEEMNYSKESVTVKCCAATAYCGHLFSSCACAAFSKHLLTIRVWNL